jgi:rhamnulokinase
MAGTNFVAFDLGAESGRAILATLHKGKLTLAEKHRFPNPTGRMNGHLHWNLLQQWEELKKGLKASAASNGGKTVTISGIGVDTWGVDFGLLDKKGEILGYPYMYRDSRTDGMMERAFKKVSREKIFNATGIQFMQFNSLFQLLAMQRDNPGLLESADKLLFMPDLFNYLFTGVKKSEFSIATTSQMYDPRKKTWATGMLKGLGLPTKLLPQVVPSGTVLGTLKRDVADECGVGQIPVIAPACHDTGSAVAAVPVEGTGDDWCYISSGTWSLMGVELDAPIINEKTLKLNYTNEGGVGGTIRFLKNIMGLWLVQECRRQFIADGFEHSYAELTKMASERPGFESLIDPDHAPFLSPGQMPGKIEAFCKKTRQRVPKDRGAFVRACLDSLALTYRRTLEGMEDVLGRRINTIHIVGGGTQNELLSQMTADACGRTVIAGPIEATAIGNVLVQAMAIGAVKSLAEARKIVRNSFPVKRYEPRETGKWDAAYDRYREVVGRG